MSQPWYRFFISLYRSMLGLKPGKPVVSVAPGASSPSLYQATVGGTFIALGGTIQISRDGVNYIDLTANAVWMARGDTIKVAWTAGAPILSFLPQGPINYV